MIIKSPIPEKSVYCAGSLLLASPGVAGARFERSVIYVIAHSEAGAMGLVINNVMKSLSFPSLLRQLGVDVPLSLAKEQEINIHCGGPVDGERGFVLHSDDYCQDSTLCMQSGIALTATMDILKDIAVGQGPKKKMLVLGYAGWDKGQLEQEILDNSWIHAPADRNIIFDDRDPWQGALSRIGINIDHLSLQCGHA